jgi:hypothetical protein
MVWIPYFETQKKLYCGMHALNNIWKNYNKERANTTFTVKNKCKSPHAVNIQKICKELLNERLLRSPKKDKDYISKEYACYSEGMFPDEVMRKVILSQQEISYNDLSTELKGLLNKSKSKSPSKLKLQKSIDESHLDLFKQLKTRCKINKQIII